jgi:hypothetical protein
MHPEVVDAIHALVEPHTQADPKFQSPLAFTRLTASAVREQLAAATTHHDWLPAVRTVRRMLDRLGYRLRRVRKTIPQKKCLKPRRSFSI